MNRGTETPESHITFHPFPLLLVLASSALVGWCVSFLASFNCQLLAGLACGIVCAITLGTSTCTKSSRLGTVIRTACTVFFIVGLIASVLLALCASTIAPYIITDGLICLAFGAVVYWLLGSGQ
ncbi:MAG: hypothetical protein K2J06_01360 [Muribaculaceae bacterium]|nr:hypothetical protein [Muribaculaceae bacterium]